MTYQSSDYIIDTWKTEYESNGTARLICRDNEYLIHIISDDGKFETEITLKDILNSLTDML